MGERRARAEVRSKDLTWAVPKHPGKASGTATRGIARPERCGDPVIGSGRDGADPCCRLPHEPLAWRRMFEGPHQETGG